MALKITLAADHGGSGLKREIRPWLQHQGFVVADLGTAVYNVSDDYPDLAGLVAGAVVKVLQMENAKRFSKEYHEPHSGSQTAGTVHPD